ncbi:MAG: hypothetical protein ACF8R7_15320 [Phycisphaerales bacterium JB039]
MVPRIQRVRPGLFALALGLLAIVPALARAQVSDVPAYYVVVQSEDATLRSGDLRNYYPIAPVKAGQVLRVDGAGSKWLRVAYPPGIKALVRGDRATVDRDAGVVRLTSPGRPKAWNLEYGVNGSWKDIPTDLLPEGTEFTFIEAATDRNGAAHYVIEAPRAARAFIEEQDVRRASQREAETYLASIGGESALIGAAVAQPAGSTPVTAPPAAGAQGGLDLADSAQTPTGPVRTPEATISQDTTPAGTPVPAIEEDPTARPIAGLAELDAAFERVRTQKALDAEIDQLISEFGAALEQVGPGAENESLRIALEQRISLLEIRKDLQRQLREVAAARGEIDAYSERVASAASEARASRQYSLVGRLETSAIYDGTRLPLMFRIQSIGEGAPRTLGYIRPAADMQLQSRVGQLVGVIGRTAMDERLKLNIVTPVRVDTLSAAEDARAGVDGEG